MPQPVKLSDDLVLSARLAAESRQRSIAGQVEYWAALGRSVERLFDGRQIAALQNSEAAPSIGELLEVVDTPVGREMVKTYLASEPFPHYRASPGGSGLLIRTEENGAETVGRFVNRQFFAEIPAGRKPSPAQ
jgi:hypothetical protein